MAYIVYRREHDQFGSVVLVYYDTLEEAQKAHPYWRPQDKSTAYANHDYISYAVYQTCTYYITRASASTDYESK